ncbi:hypothetical protein PRIC2_000513 [Phytophthora ramorum]
MADAERRVQSMPHQRLDRDPSRLTTFPVPGFMTSTFQEPDADTGDLAAAKPAASPVKTRPPPMSASNQYWMPDHLCKVCYDCSAAFSLFRRRHHCRLCGQIFCYECSNNFVSGAPHGFPGTIRVCKFCHQFADAARKKEKENDHGRHSIGSVEGDETSNSSFSSRFDHSLSRLSGENGVTKPSPLVFGPPVDPNEATMTLLSPVDSNSSDPAGSDQPTDPTSFTTESVDLFEELDSVEVQRRFRTRVRSRRRHSSAELLGAIESGGLMEAEVLALNQGKTKGSPKQHTSSVPEETQWAMADLNSDNLHTQREIALDKYMQSAHEQIREGIKHSVSSISASLPESESMDLDQLTVTLEDMAFVVTGHLLFSMNFRSPSGFNYGNLVKVKSIAMPERNQASKKEASYNFKWLAGTVCHKHLSHKQMARQVVNPRILLFACGISYDRSNGTGRMSSLDTLLEQEKSYMAILVDKISALEPDVIFVEKNVSRYAQELLCERRISIVLNAKSEMLRRIARHTGAEVLTSVDHVDKANPSKVIGRCRSFVVKSIAVVPDEGLSPAKKSLHALAGVFMKAPAVPSRLRTDTYLYLDGCDPLNGCTVLITGPSKQALRLLKQLTRAVLSMTYHLLLEAHVLSDLGLNKDMLMLKKSAYLTEKQRTTWCTTSTLRVRDPGAPNPRYHQCVEAKHLRITACSDDDVSFGNFLNQELAALSLKCQNAKCNHLMADHVHTFSCRTGTITISFEELPDKNKPSLSLTMSQVSDPGATDKSFGSFSELSFTMGSSGALSTVTESELISGNGVSSSSTIASVEPSKRLPMPFTADRNGNGKEGLRAGWKEALWDLYRVLGRSEPGSDFTIDLPDALIAGHPSLPHRSKSRVVLVDEFKPITCVAYALSTDSYEEELDGWKLRVHREAVDSVAVRRHKLNGSSVVSTNWSRAALETTMNVPFKHVAVEMPLHLSLLSGKASSTLSSTCWELTTIAYYPLQFEVLRELFYGSLHGFVFSISYVANWNASGGKSGASFYRTLDDRFVIKHISSTEMQSFLGCLPGYFKYMASIFFDGRASLLSKTVGLYQTTITRKDSGQKMVHYICVMENAFYQKQLTRTYDLKGSSRNRFAKPRPTSEVAQNGSRVLLDGNFVEFTKGHPMGVFAEDHQFILKAVQNDTAFLYSINIVDYSMVMGLSSRRDDAGGDEETPSEMTVGIIDYLRQFDLIKRVESVGKSVGMIAGQSSPTIIEPGLYGKRFRDAIRRYFMPVTPISSGTNDDK